MGTKRIGELFKVIVNRAKDTGIMRRIFRFADATNIVTKGSIWEERDCALQDGEDALNNRNVADYSADKDTRFGCKGHVSVDMGSNMIETVAAIPANVSDQDGLRHVCPKNGEMVFADKAYCLKKAQDAMKKMAHILLPF